MLKVSPEDRWMDGSTLTAHETKCFFNDVIILKVVFLLFGTISP